jgi:hypothetical protein
LVEQKLRIGISYKIANKIHKICVAAGEEGRAASLQGKKERRGLDPAPFDSVRSGGGDGDHVARRGGGYGVGRDCVLLDVPCTRAIKTKSLVAGLAEISEGADDFGGEKAVASMELVRVPI